jgi:glycosyltransferase involved in cell wall biosynthesis
VGGNRIIFEHANRLSKRGHSVEIWSNTKPEELPFPCRVPVHHLINDQLPSPSDAVIFTDVYTVSQKISAKKYFFLAQHDIELILELMGYKKAQEVVKNFFKNPPFEYEVIAVSSWVQKQLQERYHRASLLVPNGVDKDIFHPTKPLINTEKPVVMMYFDGQNWKGPYESFAAMSIIRQTIKDCRIIIISAAFPEITQFINGVRQEISCLPWPVTFFHRPQQSDLAVIYSSASVFFSSSWYEGFGLPGLEAMACGVPVVTTDSGGVREYAIPEETAIVVPPKNPEALAQGILRVLNDKKLRQKLIKNGLEKAKEFDWEKSIDTLEKIFKE